MNVKAQWPGAVHGGPHAAPRRPVATVLSVCRGAQLVCWALPTGSSAGGVGSTGARQHQQQHQQLLLPQLHCHHQQQHRHALQQTRLATAAASAARAAGHSSSGWVRGSLTSCSAAKRAAGQGSGSSGIGSGVRQQGPPDITNNMDDMEDVIEIDGDDDDDEGYDEDEEGEDGLMVDFTEDEEEFELDEDEEEDGEEGYLNVGSDDDPGPEVLTGNVEWGDTALQVAQEVLQRPENSNLELYLFRVLVPTKTIEIRLDKLDDVYGSPGLEDIERFSRALAQGLEAELGTEAAGDISFEVSTPGAERTLIIPQDLERFKSLPMRVEYRNEVGQVATLVLTFVELDEADGITCWRLANVKANQGVKGRGLSKKQRLAAYDIPLEQLERVRIYVDF